ncbi:MAG TPA: FHA domain-containing protein [Myxococcales bacterium]|nr:FHA domain-containing protein [Myxococcales bacterium]
MKLIIEDEEGRKTVVPFVREEISIGRQEGNTIRLTERNVSRKHARLLRKNGSVLVEDLGSFNGVRVNGDRIEGKLPVQEGDLIEIGDYDLAIENDAADSTATPAPERADGRSRTEPMGGGHAAATPVSGRAATLPDPALQEEPADGPARHQSTAVIRPEALADQAREVRDLAPGERPKVVIVSGDQAGQSTEIERSEFRIGRTSGDNDLAINHRSISRNHAKLVADADGSWRVLDLQSANGVRVNGEDYADAPISPGDILELGHVRLRFVGPGESYRYVPEEDRTPTPIAKPRQMPRAGRPLGLYLGAGGGLLAVLAVGSYFVFGGKPATTTPARLPDTERPLAAAPSPPHPALPTAPPKIAVAPSPLPAAAAPVEAPAPRNSRHEVLELVAQGKAALKAHELDVAESKLQAAQEASPDDPAVNRLAKEIEAVRKREAKHHKVAQAAPAEEAATPEAAAPSKADRHARALSGYQDAVGLMGGGDYPGAVVKLQKVLGIEPGMAEAHKALGICFAKLREFDKGAAHYEQYLKLKPNAADAPQVRKMLQDYYKTKGEQ